MLVCMFIQPITVLRYCPSRELKQKIKTFKRIFDMLCLSRAERKYIYYLLRFIIIYLFTTNFLQNVEGDTSNSTLPIALTLRFACPHLPLSTCLSTNCSAGFNKRLKR